MRKFLLTLITSAVLLLLPSFSQAQEGKAEVTGTVTYRERIELPSDAVINVQLLDTSIADIAAQTVADVMLNGEGRQVPVPFTLSYDPARIVSGNRYSVRATIRSGDGMLMFSTTQSYPVLTHGAPSKVNLVLFRVGHGARPGAGAKKAAPPANPQAAVEEAASAKPTEPSAASDAAPPAASSSTDDSAKPTQPSASAPAEATNDNPATGGQQIAVEPAAAPNTELTVPGNTSESKDVTAPPAVATEAASGAATTAESASTPSDATPAPPPTEEHPPSTAQTPATAGPDAPTLPESKSAAEPSTSAEQAPSTESKAETPAVAPESKSPESEPPLPEAPSASKGMESPAPSTEGSESGSEAESSSRPERALPATALTPLANTQWKLVQLNGQDVLIPSTQKPVTLAFSPEGRRIAGSAGCNSFLGTYSEEHGVLQMHPGNMTMMFCPDPAGSREKKFIAMLRTVDGYRLNGDSLVLTSNGKIVAKFKTNSAL